MKNELILNRLKIASLAADSGDPSIYLAVAGTLNDCMKDEGVRRMRTSDSSLCKIFLAAASSGDRRVVQALAPVCLERFGKAFPWFYENGKTLLFYDTNVSGRGLGGSPRPLLRVLLGKGAPIEQDRAINMVSMLVFDRGGSPFDAPPEDELRANASTLLFQTINACRIQDAVSSVELYARLGLSSKNVSSVALHNLGRLHQESLGIGPKAAAKRIALVNAVLLSFEKKFGESETIALLEREDSVCRGTASILKPIFEKILFERNASSVSRKQRAYL